MRLFHVTKRTNLQSILSEGLRPNRTGIVYLSPKPYVWKTPESDEVLLEVETRNLPLTAFGGCEKWEVLCWGHIPAIAVREVRWMSNPAALLARFSSDRSYLGLKMALLLLLFGVMAVIR